MQLGNVFSIVGDAVTAMEHFEIAIALDYPESTSVAHRFISARHKSMKRYDEARAHLLQRLDIQQHHLSSDTLSLAHTYFLLAEIEHITGNHQQRDLYMQQASCLADSSEDGHRIFFQETQRILNIPSPATL